MDNSQFPHTIRITRAGTIPEGTVYDPFNPPTIADEEVYYGEGRSYKNNKTNPQSGVLVSDYMASLPYNTIEIRAGDKIVATERNRTISGTIDDAYAGNMGVHVFWTKVNN